jgi:hypothetical protein
MAGWKKIVVSGSRAELQQLNVGANQQISSSAADTFLSGSFSGSFQGDGSKLTGLAATLALSGSNTSGSFNLGSASLSILGGVNQVNTVYSTASISQSILTVNLDSDVIISSSLSFENTASFVSASAFNANDRLTVGVSGSSDTGSFYQVISSSYADTRLSGSFSGSFRGDGSGLTGIGSNLVLTSSAGTASVNLLSQSLEVKGTSNQISASIKEDLTGSGSAQLIVALTNDVAITGSLTVGGDLTVNGTTTTINSENLIIEDQFALFASSSQNGARDGGIIISQDATGSQSGYALGIDASADRWVLQHSASATGSSLTPDSFIVSVETTTSASWAHMVASGSDNTGSIYGGTGNGTGNLLITETDIFIWA